MVISEPSPSSWHEDVSLTIFCYLTFKGHGFGIPCDSTQGDIDEYILAHCPGLQVPAAMNTMFSLDMFSEFKMQKRPELTVASQNNMASPATVPSVGSTH